MFLRTLHKWLLFVLPANSSTQNKKRTPHGVRSLLEYPYLQRNRSKQCLHRLQSPNQILTRTSRAEPQVAFSRWAEDHARRRTNLRLQQVTSHRPRVALTLRVLPVVSDLHE